ncbi:uncharacterized protein [Palaemon carinicauda]|uniref:uncharacterized protein n=1 Tax=Palaemon carinicauda TaxID=392227 RepID=UPI0035B5F2D6
MNQEDLLSLCMDFYSEEEALEAVLLAFEKYGCPEKKKEYRGAQKKENNIRQIMTLMCQSPTPEGTEFCITKCTQVPPVTMDHVDMATVLKLFSALRSEVQILSNSNRQLREKVSKIEENVSKKEITTLVKENNATKQKRKTSDEVIAEQAELLHLYRKRSDIINTDKFTSGEASKGTAELYTGEGTSNKTVTRDVTLQNDSDEDLASTTSSTSLNEWELQPWQRRKVRRQMQRRTENGPSGVPHPGLATSTKLLRRKPAVIGTNEGTGLLAAEPLTNISLFVSRLSPLVNEDELKIHVINVSGKNSVQCQKLQAKHDNYVSFKISIESIEKCKVTNLFQSVNWPKGVMLTPESSRASQHTAACSRNVAPYRRKKPRHRSIGVGHNWLYYQLPVYGQNLGEIMGATQGARHSL